MYVYETINLVNGKRYLGVSVTKDKNKSDKYLGSGVLLKRAIKKYGRDNFLKVILKEFDNEKDAREYERDIITKLNAINDYNYYNLVVGGYGGGVSKHPVSDKTKAKISKTRKLKGLKPSLQVIEKKKKKILQYDLDGKFVKVYESKVSAEKELGINLTVMNRKPIVYCGGYQWMFLNGEIVKTIPNYNHVINEQNIKVSKQVGKLSKEQVIKIVKDRELGLTYKELSVKYNISESSVYEIVIGKTYKWVWLN